MANEQDNGSILYKILFPS